MRLASLDTRIVSLRAIEDERLATASAVSTDRRSSFDERFFFGAPLASFDERFLGLAADRLYAEAVEEDGDIADAPPVTAEPAKPSRRGGQASAPASAPKKRVRTAEAPTDSSSGLELDDHTAIYDISARTVYLPNGRRLEAHSGLGEYMDDVRYVSTRMRGPTPPNVYALSLRESLFHGVRALRLTPVGNGNMYGRAGILAHTYMLGPNGQSNGCVSFSDYQAFLNAYLRGEIDHILVVEHLDNVPTSKTASDWIPEAIKSFFKRS
jgi:Tlde1 domain